jgi:hypothetical protein
MRLRIVFLLLPSLLLACARAPGPRRVEVAEKIEPRVEQSAPVKSPQKRPLAPTKRGNHTEALWHLVAPESLELVIERGRDRKQEVILIQSVLSGLRLPAGDWSIVAVVHRGKRLPATLGLGEFNFHLEKGAATYVGSYVLECPVVSNRHLPELRRMKFFNRFKFTAGDDHCELIVGNDHEKVSRAWSRLVKAPASKLLLGF